VEVYILVLRMKQFFGILVLCLGSQVGFAQSAPKYSNEFMSIGVGARAISMGQAYSAIANDVDASYYNPAGMLQFDSGFQIAAMHAEYFAGIANYDYAAFILRVDSVSAIGASFIRFAIDDIPDTRFLYDANGALNYDNIQFFSSADYGVLLSYSRVLSKLGQIQLGANAKIIHRSVGDFANAWGFGIDIGASRKFGPWMVALVVKDVTTTFNAWNHNSEELLESFSLTGNVIPGNTLELTLPSARLGAARKFTIGKMFGLLASTDFKLNFDGKRNVLLGSKWVSMDPSLGIEFDYNELGFLRFGLGDFQRIEEFDASTTLLFQPNFGIGFKYKQIAVDYALTDLGNVSETIYSNIFSIKISFEK